MRCSECNRLYTGNPASCPNCGGAFDRLRSPFSRYSRAISASRGAWAEAELTLGPAGAIPPSTLPTSTSAPREELTLPENARPHIEAESLGYLNLLLLHSGQSPLTALRVDGQSRGLFGDELVLESRPAVFEPVTVSLTAGGEPTPPTVKPDFAAFEQLEESTLGMLRVSLRRDGEAIASWEEAVTTQAPNEWINVPACAAALACAITPNSVAVTGALAGVEENLLAYQGSGAERIRMELRSIYDAVGALGIRYVAEPPSFDHTGQKILFPDDVISLRRGCCVDISILTCALLERAGYNSLVVLVSGHAFPGVWTSDLRSRQPLLSDPDRLRQAVEEGDLLVWNSTSYFLGAGGQDFEAARTAAETHLGSLQYAIDVAACREAQYPHYKPIQRHEA